MSSRDSKFSYWSSWFLRESLMNQQPHTIMATMAESYHACAFYHATPPDVSPPGPSAGEYQCQEWPVWDNQTFESVHFLGDSVIGEASLQWDTGDQAQATRQQQQPNVVGMTPEHVTTGPGTNIWQLYQHNNCQSAQNSVHTPYPYWSVPSWHGPPTTTTWQSPLGCQSPNEADGSTSAEEIVTNKSVLGRTQLMGFDESFSPSSNSYDESSQNPCHNGRDLENDSSPRPDRKKTYRINNRAAAKRCREKTRQQELDMVAMERHVTEERMYLDAYVASLKDEVLSLRNTILQHSDCDCEAIRRYISKAAGDLSLGMNPTARSSMVRGGKETQTG
ncbi:hypothetical protein LZ31DRAFT_313358 [Colletotrichum somersetense]|nr:hypothetical protein LZ31DRAFT_313358 [Colletotrichum somersetense]